MCVPIEKTLLLLISTRSRARARRIIFLRVLFPLISRLVCAHAFNRDRRKTITVVVLVDAGMCSSIKIVLRFYKQKGTLSSTFPHYIFVADNNAESALPREIRKPRRRVLFSLFIRNETRAISNEQYNIHINIL